MTTTSTPRVFTPFANPVLNHLSKDIVNFATESCGKLFSKTCCVKVVHNFDFDPICLTMMATKLIGYGIIVAASAVKIPQVLKIYKAKSGEGITVAGVLMELLAITFNTCYCYRNNFPFSAWGEAVFLGLETALITFLVLWYLDQKFKALIFSLLYSLLVYLMLCNVSMQSLWYCQSTVMYLSVSGKLFQVVKNYRSQHTGQISAVTAWSILAGSIIRVFTTIQETGDMLTASTFAAGAVANAILAIQVLYYWKSTLRFLEKGRKKKEN